MICRGRLCSAAAFSFFCLFLGGYIIIISRDHWNAIEIGNTVMKKINWFLIIISVLSLFVVSFISVSAQEINIDDMDDAELLALLQVIMEKLEKDVSAG